MASASSTAPLSDRSFFLFNGIISAVALAFLAWLLLAHEGTANGPDLRFMPGVNAALNGSAALLLIAGRFAIAKGNRDLHKRLMVSAFAASALFLIGYVAYHAVHGDTKFGGTGAIRVIYLTLLASHVLLSIVVVPGCLAAFWFAYKKEFARHTRVTRWLHPIWLYVSVTGVVVFFMLRPYY